MIVAKIAEDESDVKRFFKELALTQVYIIPKRLENTVTDMAMKAEKAGVMIGALGDVAFMGKKSKLKVVLGVLGVSVT
jgi:hypothetical protein